MSHGRQTLAVRRRIHAAINIPVPPDRDNDDRKYHREYGTTKCYGTIAQGIRRILSADDIFVPYDDCFPNYEVPTELRQFSVTPTKLLPGWGMTFRREICLGEPFDEILRYYTAEDDSDMSYRASRHGQLLVAGNAKLCHLGSDGGRTSPYLLAVFRNLNPIVLHRLYSADLTRSLQRERALMARRFFILLAKDFYTRNLTFPNARGLLYAASYLRQVLNMSREELILWYPRFQKTHFENGRKRNSRFS